MYCYLHQQRHPPVSPITEGSSLSIGRKSSSFRLANPTPVAFSNERDGGSDAPVVAADAVTVGPPNSTGFLYRAISSQVRLLPLNGSVPIYAFTTLRRRVHRDCMD